VGRAAPAAALASRTLAAGLVVAGLILAVALIATVQLGGHVVVISGRSMEPAIPLGALVIAEPFRGARPQPGEAVTFVADNWRLVTHRVQRVVEEEGSAYVATKGDANAEPDPVVVPQSKLVGRVTIAVPWLGYVVVAMSRPQGWAAFLGILLFLWLASALLRDLATPLGAPQATRGYVPSPWGP
jgi:signal peptidase I